jgi:uncharacterized Fe-S cluster protein YjdI
MEKKTSKSYTNGEVTVHWEPGKCIHSANCVKGLPGVFNTKLRPWINIDGADTAAIVAQVNNCPSKALTYSMNDEKTSAAAVTDHTSIEMMPNGPMLVHGSVSIKHSDGRTEQREKVSAFCRCGASANKPFCDGSHRSCGFQG